MKKSGYWRLLCLGLTGLPFVGACRQEAGPISEVAPAELYDQMCLRCHGPNGKGDSTIAQTMPVKDLTSPAVVALGSERLGQIITAGQNQMPAFGNALTPRKIQSLVGYVLKMGEKK
ncbi:MAG: cytochrome c [Deltaproteobacteria bacterium]|nr:cytochrome c [Deltaproteobacteria bacterium]